MKKWVGYVFEGSSEKTPEFRAFARDFKKELKAQLMPGMKLVEYLVGHFYVSGFIQGKGLVYFMTTDVRFDQDLWFNHLLIRTAKDTRDFTGGPNHYTRFADIGESVKELM